MGMSVAGFWEEFQEAAEDDKARAAAEARRQRAMPKHRKR